MMAIPSLDSQRPLRPGVWIWGRALLYTLIVLLAITFDQGGWSEGFAGASATVGWPLPCGYLAALGLIYLTSCAYLVAGRRIGASGVLVVLLLDVPAVAAIVHWTGGIDSHFVLVYMPLALAAGILHGVGGGLLLALASCVSYGLVLGAECWGWLAPRAYAGGVPRLPVADGSDPALIGLQVMTLLLTGLVAGLLGKAAAEHERALHTASRRLARANFDTSYVIEHLGSGLLSLDEAGTILHFSRTAGRILGVDPATVIGRPATSALPPGAAPFVRWLEGARHGLEPLVRREVEIETADGRTIPIGMTGTRTSPEMNGVRIAPAGGIAGAGETAVRAAAEPGGLIALFQDLTHARHEQAERVRQQQLAKIGELAAGIAHEIRNCVKPISGSLDVLQRELPLAGANRRLMELAVRECNHLGRFVQAMLDYGRVNPLAIEHQRLDELVEDAGESAAISAPARHRVRVEIAADARGLGAAIDREQLEQVLLNLCMNGLEAMGEKDGTVTIGLATELGAGGAAGAGGAPRAVISVGDTGPGIEPDVRPHIFEPFFTTKNGGTGFGLAIAASIIERHGGSLTVDSEPGAGACFRISLPVFPEPAAGGGAEAAA